MRRLIKSEFFQLLKSNFYWRICIANIVLALLAFAFDRTLGSDYELKGLDWFCVRRLRISWLLYIICIYTSEYMAGEFHNHRYNTKLICGFTRRQIYGAKLAVYVSGMLPLLVINTAIGTLVRTICYGFGTDFNENIVIRIAKAELYYVLFCFVVGAVSVLFAMMTKSRAVAFVLGVCINQWGGSLLANLPYYLKHMGDYVLKKGIDCFAQLMPIYQIDSILVPQEYKPHPIGLFLLSCNIWLVVIYVLSMNLFENSDLD